MLLLEACADDTPTAPGDQDTSIPAAMGMNRDGTQVVIEPQWLTLDTIDVTGTLTATVIDAEGDTVQDAEVVWASADTATATVDTAGVVTAAAFGKTRVTATYDSANAWATVEVALPLTDREILEIFYEATGGKNWTEDTNWLSDEDLSEWYGVWTDGDGRVIRLSLRQNELTGAIPAEIGGLSRLDYSVLGNNSVSGSIPAELGKLAQLRRLDLNNNHFEGALPPEMGGMKTLEYFDVAHNNRVVGAVPHTFARLELETFYSNETELCLPPSLKAWFDEISQTDNPTVCTGRVMLDPPSLYFGAPPLGDTARLSATAVSAEGDTLHVATVTWSSSDAAIATVDSTGLVTTVGYGTTEIRATSDSLTGTSEVEIVFKLSDREVLDTLYRVTGGENWRDTANWLSDEPLSEWFGVETNEAGKVVGLSLGNNNLTGSVPSVIAKLDDLVTLDLSRNALAGRISSELGALQQLRDLLLNGNALEGLLPRELGDMAGLRYLHIGSNKFAGVVPGSFAGLELDTLYAADSGVCVPPSLDDWHAGIGQTDDAARCVDHITIEVVDLPSLTFYAPGETATLSASYVDAEGDTTGAVPVTWSSGDTAVASVDEAGTVTAVGEGSTKVTATHDSITASIAAEVALPENDRDVLKTFYDRALGDGWTDGTNWLSDEPLSEWAGVETDDSGRVVGLSLPGNNVKGPIHSSIGQLDRLVTLDLSRNWVTGSVPPEVGKLARLRELVLNVNGVGGELPEELGNLDSLRTVNLVATLVSGRVPASFADLELDTLLVNGTSLCVPPSLASWLDSIPQTDSPPTCSSRVTLDPTSLTFNAVGDTARLSVTVIGPDGDIVDDAEVTWASSDARVARVNGSGLMTARTSGVTTITATYDSVSTAADVAVALPGSDRVALEALYHATGGDDWTDNTNWLSDEPLGEWSGVNTTGDGRVRSLWLTENNLTGRIPAAIGLLDSLSSLELERNTLTGPIPPSIGRLPRLRVLFLRENEGLIGPLPPEMGNVEGLEWLDLDNTGLSGPVPETFANLTLDHFYHSNTGLCVPRSLAAWYESLGQRDPLPCIPETPDREVLVTFFNSTGGPDWESRQNWLKPWSINTWTGITTDEEGYVTELILVTHNITGSLPPQLGNLTRLEQLILYGNNLTGRIPPELGKLTKLRQLLLSDNQLEGPIPPEMGNMSNLHTLSLSYTDLSGPIPPALGNLTNLEYFASYWAQLSGPIPPELGKLKKLKELWLTGNYLESIPPELGNLDSLVHLGLHNNHLSGSIPPELGNLSSLQRLILYENRLTGSIPPELGNLSSLVDFWLSENQLTGTIPGELGRLAKVKDLGVQDNKLSGPIPPELGQLSTLVQLALHKNNLSGPIPPEIGELGNLVDLRLYENNLSGPIPPEIGELNNLEVLYLNENELSGPIPPELGKMSSLERLSLHDNKLTGAIPPELGDLPSLVDFWLSENQLTGTIPAELGRLPRVEDLGVQNNNLSGPIPPELGQLFTLAGLNLANNNLSGPIAPEMGELINLGHLDLKDNPDLEGLLPRSFMNLPLHYLDIGGTDVCPPLDDVFQAWLRKIPSAYGLICPATLVERFALSEFYTRTGGDSWTHTSGWNSDSPVEDWYGVTVGDSLVQRLDLPDNGLRGSFPPEVGNLRALETLDLADNSLAGRLTSAIISMDALDTIRVSGNTNMQGPLPSRMIEMTGLKALQYADTDLCAPPSATFQVWLDGLDSAAGVTCVNPDEVLLSLPVVYLTQAIQRPKGDVPLLSNREALLRVFLVGDQEHAFFEPEVLATFTRDGEEVHRVVMTSERELLATSSDEGGLLNSYNAVIPAEHIVAGTELVVVADSAGTIPRAAGSQTRFPQTGFYALEVIDAPPMELTVVPVLEAENPDSSVFEWTDSIDDDSPHVSQFKHSFPFSEFSARARDAYIASLDLTSDDDQWKLVLELEVVRRNEEATGYWYGAALSNNGYVRGVARRNGWVSIGKPLGPELAHEVGHTLNLRHAPCGGALGTDPDFPYTNGSIGVWGYDFRDGFVLSPQHIRDVMGYCYRGGTAWLSDYYYEKVIDLREEKEGKEAEEGAATGPKGEMLVLWGGVLGDELRIEPVHSMYTTPKLPEAAGAYSLEGYGRSGQVEFSLSFTPGEDEYGNKYFFFTIPIEADWEDSLERITLTGPEGEVTVDGNDPRSLTIVTDPATGRIRAILRDWDRPLPAALGDTAGLEVVTTRGIVEAVRLRR